MTFSSFYPIERAELVVNGAVVQRWEWSEGRREGALRHGFRAERDGWVAARLWGDSRDSFDQSIYAHSSPSYFRGGAPPAEREAEANFFLRSIDESLKWIDSYGRYNNDQQREGRAGTVQEGARGVRGVDSLSGHQARVIAPNSRGVTVYTGLFLIFLLKLARAAGGTICWTRSLAAGKEAFQDLPKEIIGRHGELGLGAFDEHEGALDFGAGEEGVFAHLLDPLYLGQPPDGDSNPAIALLANGGAQPLGQPLGQHEHGSLKALV